MYDASIGRAVPGIAAFGSLGTSVSADVGPFNPDVASGRVRELHFDQVQRTCARYRLEVPLVVIEQVGREVAVLAGGHVRTAKDLFDEGTRHTA